MNKYQHGGDIYSSEKHVFDFSANINPLGMPVEAESSIIKHIDQYNVYPDHFNRKLTEALALYLDVPTKEIVVGNGAADLIFRLCLATKPQKALIIGPTFSEYEEAVLQSGGQVEYFILEPPFEFDQERNLKDIETKLEGCDLVFLCSPNNPNGSCVSLETVFQLDSLCKKCGCILVVDQCFVELSSNEEEFSVLKIWESLSATVILRAFTKSFAMAGVRLGYMVLKNQALAQKIQGTLQPWPVSSVATWAGIGALESAMKTNYLKDSKELILEQRKYLEENLKKFGFTVFQGQANFILFYGEPDSFGDLQYKMAELGFLIRDCSNFEGLRKGYYRIAVRTPEENQLLIKNVSKVLGISIDEQEI